MSRTQVLHVSVSSDGGQTYQELRRQEYTFSPPGTTFEREEWALTVEGVTHLQMVITPDKGGPPAGRPSPRWSCSDAATLVWREGLKMCRRMRQAPPAGRDPWR